jgi:uncharacterized protein (TIGR03437 family)
LFFSAAMTIWAHAAPVNTPVAPLHVTGRFLADANGRTAQLVGVQMRGLEVFTATESSKALVNALNPLTFRIIRQRWNLNSVRILISPWVWKRDGQDYIAKVGEIVRQANAEQLVVVLVASNEEQAGAPPNAGLPGAEMEEFWSAWAAFFKDTPMLIFDLYSRPSAAQVPNATPGIRQSSDWGFWRSGGTATDGRSVSGMQALVSRIRAAGATQVVAAAAFHDPLDFQAFGAANFLQDRDVIYEIHPYFDHGLTSQQRDRNFGFLVPTIPLYAGEWGAPLQEDSATCRSVPGTPTGATDATIAILAYLGGYQISWSAASFEPQQLVTNLDTFAPTVLEHSWTCAPNAGSPQGIGQTLLLWQTGDQYGFGSILPELVASAADLRVGPIAPGQIVRLFGQNVGPEFEVPGQILDTGRLATSAGDTEVLFDGVPAPILSSGYFQVTVQVPYEVSGRTTTVMQAFNRKVPSNALTLTVADTSPGAFTTIGATDAIALNQDGALNSAAVPAPADSVVAFYVNGAGQTAPPGVTGRVAIAPFREIAAPVSVQISSLHAEILYSGEAPGLVGVSQVNVRVPASLASGGSGRPVTVSISVGGRTASTARIWVR